MVRGIACGVRSLTSQKLRELVNFSGASNSMEGQTGGIDCSGCQLMPVINTGVTAPK